MPADVTPFSWAIQSRVTLCRVAWDDSYKDVVSFESPEKRNEYFDSLKSESIVLDNYTYLKPNEPIIIDVPFHKAYTFNYLIVDNPKTNDPDDVTPPRFYYFIEGAAMLNPSTTALTLQLDVFQTYLWKFRLGVCFVERGHLAMAAMHNRLESGKYNTAETMRIFGVASEGLDVGSEYTITHAEMFDLSAKKWAVIVQSNTDLATDWGTRDNPSLKTADGQMTDGLASGCNVYAIESWDYSEFMKKVRDAPWVAKGIVSISAFPKTVLTDGPSVSLNGIDAHFLGDTPDEGVYFTSDEPILEQLGSLTNDDFKFADKLKCFPYAVIEIVNYQGNSLLLKPEMVNDKKLTLKQMACAAPPYQKIAFFPAHYGEAVGDSGYGKAGYYTMDYKEGQYSEKTHEVNYGYWLDTAIWFQDFPQMSIVNDEYVNYLASTTNRRQFSYNAAGWSQQKSLAGNQLTYDQAQQQLATNQANQDLTNIQAGINGAIGAIGGGLSGNPAGVVLGTAGTISNMVTSNMQFQNNQDLSRQFATQNKTLADWAARGDYQNAVAGIDATVQDAALTQPSQSGQMAGDGFNLSNGMMIVQIRYKTITTQMQEIVGNYFLKYGYAIRQYLVPPKDFMAMQKFTYWKMLDTSIICSTADEGVKNAIRGIFEKGVTVWRDPLDIGRIYGASNAPIPNIYGYDREVK
nr:MAG TPA: Major tail protein [Caudoviricetes sp.]